MHYKVFKAGMINALKLFYNSLYIKALSKVLPEIVFIFSTSKLHA